MRLNGCAASAYAALFADVDVITAYPIRPYTAIMMALAQIVADGLLDAEYLHADSEHAQISAALGAGLLRRARLHGQLRSRRQFAYEVYSPTAGAASRCR